MESFKENLAIHHVALFGVTELKAGVVQKVMAEIQSCLKIELPSRCCGTGSN